MNTLMNKMDWKVNTAPCPGSHSTLPEDDALPWKCISEVIPGLYLTCAEMASDYDHCLENGIGLILNLCGEAYKGKYRVWERTTEASHGFRSFASREEFIDTLDNYCQCAASLSFRERKLFIVTIAAEDVPTYSIENHFLECCILIEVVLRHFRETLKTVENDDANITPSVLVHCMVGVSRSAAIIMAYLMKKYGMSRDEAITFVRCTRPVVQPNPGFQRQLSLWEDLCCCRIIDEWSARVIADEIRNSGTLLAMVESSLSFLLRSYKCEHERHFFGLLVSMSEPSSEDLHTIYREIRSTVTADIDSEVYVDIPNYFGYVAELVKSLETYEPNIMRHMSLPFENPLVWCDSFYYRVVKDIARSGYVKEVYDTARAFCSLFEAIYLKHLKTDGKGQPRVIGPVRNGEPLPDSYSLSVPFLFFVAPYVEGFIQFSELHDLSIEFPTEGEAFSSMDQERLQQSVTNIFLSSFFRTSCGGGASSTNGAAKGPSARLLQDSRLNYLQGDVEVRVFEEVERLAMEGAVAQSLESLQSFIEPNLSADVARIAYAKIMSSVIAFRIVAEAAERFTIQTYYARIDRLQMADSLLPLTVIANTQQFMEAIFNEEFGEPLPIRAFFQYELEALRECGVLGDAGVVSLFVADV